MRARQPHLSVPTFSVPSVPYRRSRYWHPRLRSIRSIFHYTSTFRLAVGFAQFFPDYYLDLISKPPHIDIGKGSTWQVHETSVAQAFCLSLSPQPSCVARRSVSPVRDTHRRLYSKYLALRIGRLSFAHTLFYVRARKLKSGKLTTLRLNAPRRCLTRRSYTT